MSAASIITLSPRAFGSLLHAADVATCRPRCEPPPACRPVTPCCDRFDPCDVVDCRDLLLNQALREIDLLRSGLENAADLRATRDASPARCEAAAEPSAHGALHTQRPIYAVRPLGEIPAASRERLSVITHQSIVIDVVTNLGTLMDVLI